MSDKKISELTAAATLDGSELVNVVQSSANVKATTAAIAALASAGGGGRSIISKSAFATGSNTTFTVFDGPVGTLAVGDILHLYAMVRFDVSASGTLTMKQFQNGTQINSNTISHGAMLAGLLELDLYCTVSAIPLSQTCFALARLGGTSVSTIQEMQFVSVSQTGNLKYEVSVTSGTASWTLVSAYLEKM